MNEEEFAELLRNLRFMKSNYERNFDVSRFMSADLTQDQKRKLEKEFGQVKTVIDMPYNYYENDYFWGGKMKNNNIPECCGRKMTLALDLGRFWEARCDVCGETVYIKKEVPKPQMISD